MDTNNRVQARTRGHVWTLIRTAQLSKQPLCEHCLALGVVTAAEQVDHIKSLEHGGTDDEDNLQSLCCVCHLKKTTLDRGYKQRTAFGEDGLPLDSAGLPGW